MCMSLQIRKLQYNSKVHKEDNSLSNVYKTSVVARQMQRVHKYRLSKNNFMKLYSFRNPYSHGLGPRHTTKSIIFSNK